jgi:thiamine biosynthesis protein ThiS
MTIQINGAAKEVSDGVTLTQLLGELQIRPARVVVELNRAIVPRDSFGATLLRAGDSLEIVHFVGGG